MVIQFSNRMMLENDVSWWVWYVKLQSQVEIREAQNHFWLESYHVETEIEVVWSGGMFTHDVWMWDLDYRWKTRKRINGTNIIMLARITGKSIPQEARSASTSLNIIKKIRMCRHRWLGYILRRGPGSIAFQTLKVQSQMGEEGNPLMDTPT